MIKSVWHSPHAVTLTRTSVSRRQGKSGQRFSDSAILRLLTIWLWVLEFNVAELERSIEFLEHERLSLEHVARERGSVVREKEKARAEWGKAR